MTELEVKTKRIFVDFWEKEIIAIKSELEI